MYSVLKIETCEILTSNQTVLQECDHRIIIKSRQKSEYAPPLRLSKFHEVYNTQK